MADQALRAQNGNSRRAEPGMDFGYGFEKKSIERHGIGHAGAGQDRSVEGGEDGNHGRDGNEVGAGLAEDLAHHVGGDQVAEGDFPGRQDIKVGGICQ